MPNHITNILKAEGPTEKVKELFNSIKGEKTIIDFNKIIPMPESLNVTSGSNVDNAIAILTNDNKLFSEMLDWNWVKEENINSIEQLKERLMKNISEKDMEEAKISLYNIEKYGHKNWYSWSIANWGTKWNAYDTTLNSENEISFDTAWSTPFPVMEQLAKKYPELTISVAFADEDIGNNCGVYVFENGMLSKEYLPNGWEAQKFAMQVKGCDNDLKVMVAETIPCVRKIEKDLEVDLISILNSPQEEVIEFLEMVRFGCYDESYIDNSKEILKKVALENELYELIKYIDDMKM